MGRTFELICNKQHIKGIKRLRALSSVGRRNSMRVNEGRNSWSSILAIKTKARTGVGRGGKLPAIAPVQSLSTDGAPQYCGSGTIRGSVGCRHSAGCRLLFSTGFPGRQMPALWYRGTTDCVSPFGLRGLGVSEGKHVENIRIIQQKQPKEETTAVCTSTTLRVVPTVVQIYHDTE